MLLRTWNVHTNFATSGCHSRPWEIQGLASVERLPGIACAADMFLASLCLQSSSRLPNLGFDLFRGQAWNILTCMTLMRSITYSRPEPEVSRLAEPLY